MANYTALHALAQVCDSVFQCTGSFLSHTIRHQLPELFCVTAKSVNIETSHAFREQCLEFVPSYGSGHGECSTPSLPVFCFPQLQLPMDKYNISR